MDSATKVPNVKPKEGGLTSESIALERYANRSFPSVFAAWRTSEGPNVNVSNLAKYDLVFTSPYQLKLRWNKGSEGISDSLTLESATNAMAMRKELQKQNPNVTILAELRFFDAKSDFFGSEGKGSWLNVEGHKVESYVGKGYFQIDLTDEKFQEAVVMRAKALMGSGAIDGIMLDNWLRAKSVAANLLKRIREEVGDEALIIVNSSSSKIPESQASLINGLFIECNRSKTTEDWEKIEDTLKWASSAKSMLREPKIICLETWGGEGDIEKLKATTALASIYGACCLFSQVGWDHEHKWQGDLWGNKLGKPTKDPKERSDGSVEREFENGIAVYNPVRNKTVNVLFTRKMLSSPDPKLANEFILKPGEGGIYLKPTIGDII
jgi:hypothetical protein